MPKLHELTGHITKKEPRKVYTKSSPYYGNLFYKLTIDQQELPVFIYPNLTPPQIFQAIEQSQFIDKRYLLFCEKKPKRWILHNWKELPNKFPPFTELKNYEKK